jgi:predicted molibdopterin-dependent oxidoreductase YjgC
MAAPVYVGLPKRLVELTIDGETVAGPEGTTLLEACRAQDIDTPTLCYLETLTPVNVCRVCVVEVEGSRVLVPACSRPVEPGMVVHTDSRRVRTSRRMVLELLASSVDLSRADGPVHGWMERYGVDAGRHGPQAATVAEPPKIDNDLYIRDYARCILCYKCVEACGEDAQNTFAIAVGERGFEAGITTEFDVPLTDSACVYCGNCIGVCPTGALMPKSEYDMRQAGTWDESRQAVTANSLVRLAGYAPPNLHARAARVASAEARYNVALSNAPGPQEPRYLAGRRMEEAYPFIPLAGNSALSVAVSSYVGEVFLGLLGERSDMPDLDVLGRGIGEALADLVAAADTD